MLSVGEGCCCSRHFTSRHLLGSSISLINVHSRSSKPDITPCRTSWLIGIEIRTRCQQDAGPPFPGTGALAWWWSHWWRYFTRQISLLSMHHPLCVLSLPHICLLMLVLFLYVLNGDVGEYLFEQIRRDTALTTRIAVLVTDKKCNSYSDFWFAENGTPVFEVPTFPEWEQPLDTAKLLSWYPSTSSKIDVGELPGLPFTSFQTLLVARELSLQNYIKFLPVPEVSESAPKDMARSTFNDLEICVRQRSSDLNLEWHLSGTTCYFERCQALLHRTQPEGTAMVLVSIMTMDWLFLSRMALRIYGCTLLIDSRCAAEVLLLLKRCMHRSWTARTEWMYQGMT